MFFILINNIILLNGSFRCISGLLKNKCRVLVTHQLQHLRAADQILVLKEVCVPIIRNNSIKLLKLIRSSEIEGDVFLFLRVSHLFVSPRVTSCARVRTTSCSTRASTSCLF